MLGYQLQTVSTTSFWHPKTTNKLQDVGIKPSFVPFQLRITREPPSLRFIRPTRKVRAGAAGAAGGEEGALLESGQAATS